jgi:hypothetical protein
MKNQPNKIFLQIGLEKEGSVEDFNSLVTDFVTWESERIFSDDLHYISVSSVLARIKELEEKLTPKISTQTRATILYTIDELKNLIK